MLKSKQLRKANLEFYKNLFNGTIDLITLLEKERPKIFPKSKRN